MTVISKYFKLNGEDLAMFDFVKSEFDIKKDVDVFRFCMAKVYSESLKEYYDASPEREFLTFDEYVSVALVKGQKKLGVL